MPVAAVCSAGIAAWRIHAGTIEGPLLLYRRKAAVYTRYVYTAEAVD